MPKYHQTIGMSHVATTSAVKDSILDTIGDTPLVRLSRIGAGLRPAARRQARDVQPGRLDQGPRRGRADRGRRARRAAASRRDDRRADVGQHRHRTGDRRAAEGLPRDRGDAGQDVEGEDRPAARLRGRGRRRADRRAAGLAAVLLPRRRSADRGDPRRLPAQSVLQPGQPAGALRVDRTGAVGADRRSDHAPRRRRRAPAARSPARSATCASAARISS